MPPAERQLSASTQALLAIKGMKQEAPIFVRIFKEESEFEVWKFKDGRFQHFRTYPICAWSGGLGPKVQQGDRQAPEGFYTVSRGQMNPHSLYHLAFNIGFPNAYDAANGHNGSALMVHGDCKCAGCYAMTDAYIEEIYILAREAFNAGQTKFHVQALPFHMTVANMQRHRDSPWYPFWIKLKEKVQFLEATGRPPIVKVCSKQYLVNVSFPASFRPRARRCLPGLFQNRPCLDPGNEGDAADAGGKPEQGRDGPSGAAAAASARDVGKCPGRAGACRGYVRFAGYFPCRPETGRDRKHATPEGARVARLYGFRCPICRANRTGARRGRHGAASELSRRFSSGSRRPARIFSSLRPDRTNGPECAAKGEPLGQGRQAPRRRRSAG